MTGNQLQDIEKVERSLWESADQLRANSNLSSSEYCMPALGIIFLRHAANRYDAALAAIKADQAAGKMPKRALVKADFLKRSALMLSEEELALFDLLQKQDLGKAERERLKLAAKSLLDELRRLIEPLDQWTQKEQTQAEVEVFILDHVLQLLPTPPFTPEEKETAARKAYRHIWQQSASGLFPERRAA